MKFINVAFVILLFGANGYDFATIVAHDQIPTFNAPHNRNVAPNVAVDLYYEALCPDCRKYFLEQLYPTWLIMSDIMDVRLFPFGNAKYTKKPNGGYNFTCQHGPKECKANMIHACAQHFFNDIYVEMPFVNCLHNAESPVDAGPECCKLVNKDWAPIHRCVNDIQGEELLHNVAVQQGKLNPPVDYVPWIVVEGIHSKNEQKVCESDMNLCICQRYTGTLPDYCRH